MSDFAELWKQQMDDPEMRAMMEATNDLLGRPQDGCKRLAEMDLSDEERARIDRILAYPRYPKAEDAIILQVCGRTKLARWIGARRVRRYRAAFQKNHKK